MSDYSVLRHEQNFAGECVAWCPACRHREAFGVSERAPAPAQNSGETHVALMERVYARIAHGDDKHRSWLRDELRKFGVELDAEGA